MTLVQLLGIFNIAMECLALHSTLPSFSPGSLHRVHSSSDVSIIAKMQDSPPPGYSAPPESLQPEGPQVPQHEDLAQEQIGGGRRYEDTPVEHTPTKLCSHIKATNRDAGLVKEASAHQAKLLNDKLGQPVAQHREPSAPPPHLVHPGTDDKSSRCY
ncbi:hypothetical protein EDD22DRAFT_948938 [Suillus occidentalis]|nr:hypothetical protein EDD22DRAFT_948938 [Suillus occidentalis]